jgi:hypothetical protein
MISRNICPHWLRTSIILISASWVARITGVSRWTAPQFYFLIETLMKHKINHFKVHNSVFFSTCAVLYTNICLLPKYLHPKPSYCHEPPLFWVLVEWMAVEIQLKAVQPLCLHFDL